MLDVSLFTRLLTGFKSASLQTKIGIIGIILGLGCVFLGLLLVRQSARSFGSDPQESSSVPVLGSIVVDVSGAVVQPGVYQVAVGDRWALAVKLAGGILPQADQEFVGRQLNLAKELEDGAKIYIPFSDEVIISDSVSDHTEIVPSNSSGISINTASLEQLDSLPGIGPKRAQDIIDNRPYLELIELVDRDIISETIFEDIEPLTAL